MTRQIPAFIAPVTETREVTLTLNDNDLIMIRNLVANGCAKAKQEGRKDRCDWLAEVHDKINHALYPERY